MIDAPLIVTAELPQDLHARFTALRTEHFPPERNYLEAHVTLFHALPPSCEGEVSGELVRLCAAHAPVPGRIEGVMNLGGGTAIRLSSEAMLALRDELADRFSGLLTPQDQHRPRLHVTVQNKVTSAEAKALQHVLGPQVTPRDFAFRGLALHAYRGGPWDLIKRWSFRG